MYRLREALSFCYIESGGLVCFASSNERLPHGPRIKDRLHPGSRATCYYFQGCKGCCPLHDRTRPGCVDDVTKRPEYMGEESKKKKRN